MENEVSSELFSRGEGTDRFSTAFFSYRCFKLRIKWQFIRLSWAKFKKPHTVHPTPSNKALTILEDLMSNGAAQNTTQYCLKSTTSAQLLLF